MKVSGGFNTDLPIEIMVSAIITFSFIITIFIIQAIFLNKLSKLKTQKKSIAAWIPIGNVYAVGKITINKWIGLGMMILYLLSSFKTEFTETITINNKSQQISKISSSLLPEFVGNILGFVILGFYIYAIYQYITLKKKQKEPDNISNENNSQTAVNEPSISVETLPNITENKGTQQTTSKQDSNSSPLQDLYK